MDSIKLINIVAIGNWNKRIFTPQWVSSRLFPTADSIEGLLNQEDVELGYKHGGITVFPKDSLLEIRVDEIKYCSNAIAIFNKIIKELPHTPIKAVGFNIRYDIIRNLTTIILENDQCPDGFTPTSVKMTKQYSNNHFLNIDISATATVVNEHYQLGNEVPLPTFSEDLFDELNKCSTNILKNE